jgi:8-hydroxy-5-deazaflavin:NADPH oxidoreductase
MPTVGLIGSGYIGSTVARLAITVGHEVILSNSRGPDTLQELAFELGAHARAGTSEEAAAAGDIVLVSIPLKAYPKLSGAPLAGKVVMDTGNYYPQRDGQIPELDNKSLTDSEYLLGYLPGAQVVKVLAEGWRQQPGTPVYATPYGSFDNEEGTPADADVTRSALAAATR